MFGTLSQAPEQAVATVEKQQRQVLVADQTGCRFMAVPFNLKPTYDAGHSVRWTSAFQSSLTPLVSSLIKYHFDKSPPTQIIDSF
jgi:hypothetical protein